jgi:predicted RNase H-like HicB family nuclease
VALERWKLYRQFPDADAEGHSQVRVVDESGEDYLFPKAYFAPIALRRSKEGYSVSVPALPGCRSQGESEREAVENIQVAIREYVSVAEDLGRRPGFRDGVSRSLALRARDEELKGGRDA